MDHEGRRVRAVDKPSGTPLRAAHASGGSASPCEVLLERAEDAVPGGVEVVVGLVPLPAVAPSELGHLHPGALVGIVRAEPEQDDRALGARLGQVRRGVPREREHGRGLEADHLAVLGTTVARLRLGQEVPLVGPADAQLDPGVVHEPRADAGVGGPGPPDVLDGGGHGDGLVQDALGGGEVVHGSSRVLGVHESGIGPAAVSRLEGGGRGVAVGPLRRLSGAGTPVP